MARKTNPAAMGGRGKQKTEAYRSYMARSVGQQLRAFKGKELSRADSASRQRYASLKAQQAELRKMKGEVSKGKVLSSTTVWKRLQEAETRLRGNRAEAADLRRELHLKRQQGAFSEEALFLKAIEARWRGSETWTKTSGGQFEWLEAESLRTGKSVSELFESWKKENAAWLKQEQELFKQRLEEGWAFEEAYEELKQDLGFALIKGGVELW